MTTVQTKKVNINTVNRLNSTNAAMVLKTIEELREAGNAAYVPFLVEVLHATENQDIKSNIHRLLAELKHRDAVPLLIEAVKNEKYASERAKLVSACWENGLDYSSDLPLFVDLVIANDLVVAFEAYTVITNMSGKISEEIIDIETEKIRKAMLRSDAQKKELLHDLVHFLPAFKEGIEPQSF
jgi:hypothetical protein